MIEATVKTDKLDARILAQPLAADFLPRVWLPDDRTRSASRQVMRRAHLARPTDPGQKPDSCDPGPQSSSGTAGLGLVRHNRSALAVASTAIR
jgi:hypothetical protein